MHKNIFYKVNKNIRKLTEFPLVKIEDRIVINSKDSLIPNNVYQTWETRYLGKTHAKSLIDFRNTNPSMSFYLYDKDKRDNYLKKNWSGHPIYNVYSNSLFGPMKADIFRYCILYDLGGYYFDLYGSYDYAWYIAIGLSVFASLVHLPINEKPIERNLKLI